jgi:hypothetical protein
VDNPEHTHPLSGKKARIQKEINSLKNPAFRHASMPKRSKLQKWQAKNRVKKGSCAPFPEHMHPGSPWGAKTRGIPEHTHPFSRFKALA